jgi:hypothetical protein
VPGSNSSYYPGLGADTGQCTQCVLGWLVDGGSAAVRSSVCGTPDCKAMTTCVQRCAQPQ